MLILISNKLCWLALLLRRWVPILNNMCLVHAPMYVSSFLFSYLLLMLFSLSQLGMHGTWQEVSIMHLFTCKWHCVALCGCYWAAIFFPSPHVVLPFTTGNEWNMIESEYNASIHLQVTLCCIVWLLLSCRFLLPPLMLFFPSQLGIHGTWQGVSIMHLFTLSDIALHCVVVIELPFSSPPLMLFSPSQLGMNGTW